jgi:hypothetical protein
MKFAKIKFRDHPFMTTVIAQKWNSDYLGKTKGKGHETVFIRTGPLVHLFGFFAGTNTRIFES